MFLPINQKEMKALGWDRPDFLYVTGDAYVDHPSFGTAIISRVLEHRGYRVAILPQPNWKNCDDFLQFGRPRLGVLVSSGNLDSMVNHYTAAKRKRHEDAYSPGGKAGMRPDRAVIVYCNRVREAFGDIPLIIGGVEASLRRFAHYDYWDNKVRRSVLADSRADLISFGMGEHSVAAIADELNKGKSVREIRHIPGTVYWASKEELPNDVCLLPSCEQVTENKRAYADSVRIQYEQQDPIRGRVLAQAHQNRYVVQNKPAMPLTTEEMDEVYDLPYERECHPSYTEGVPAIREVRFSLTSCRGCYGSCNFCALTFHQGRIVSARSHDSLIREATLLTRHPQFKGYLHDVGGPTANFRRPACAKQLSHGTCADKRCLFPKVCRNIRPDHRDYLTLLRKLKRIDGVKKVFVRSGIRYDYLLADPDPTFFRELCREHISGQLKVAPEHISESVLSFMGKPSFAVYREFYRKYTEYNKERKQYLVPYFMSSHPGCTLSDAIELALYFKKMHYIPEQVQDFYPTPGTVSTCMYHTGLDPFTMQPLYVAKTPEEKQMQRALLQFSHPENFPAVRRALVAAQREDLIGFGPSCLVPPRQTHQIKSNGGTYNGSNNSGRKGSRANHSGGSENTGRRTEKGRARAGSGGRDRRR